VRDNKYIFRRERDSRQHVQIIPINVGEVSNVTKQQKKKVSRITVNSQFNLEKPSVPDRPKNIGDIKKILERKNSPKDANDRNIELMKSTFLRRASKETNAKCGRLSTHELVSDVQFEILKILSEKDDLRKENELLRQYRQSYIDIVMENNILRQKLQILEISPERNTKQNRARLRPRSDPDGQEDSKINSCFSIK